MGDAFPNQLMNSHLDPNDDDEPRPKKAGMRVLSFCLLIGGAAGLIIVLIPTLSNVAGAPLELIAIWAIVVATFICDIIAGIWMWTANPRGRRWGQVLFALQRWSPQRWMINLMNGP